MDKLSKFAANSHKATQQTDGIEQQYQRESADIFKLIKKYTDKIIDE